ncbi:hypothetical protein Aph01nite_33510 [Acrocarpospora phusangensis]|uniref:SIR2-like domain-containing protein n=1 Tax=Acrocarpospora phusangensis TaxID=1070424 RepID=A0A919QBM1_9ACTN|nr:SIR2 family protein [Acrocarpospora phusangensis]GIH25041.1 hypothetical protein Aph01nite_33510 [Acrocarpospora phusangensis]
MVVPPALPGDLVAALRERRAALFIGAGVSLSAGLPDWNALVSELAADLGIAPDMDRGYSPSLLPVIPQYYANEFGMKSLCIRVDRMLRPTVPFSRPHTLLARLPCDLFYTTNLDTLLETALLAAHRSFDLVLDDDTARRYMERRVGSPQVRKIHGSVGFASSYVLTRAQYARFEYDRPVLTQALRHDLSSFNFLFVGYSLSDPDFNSIYEHVLASMGEMTPRHYALLLSPSDYEVNDLKRRGVTAIDLSRWPGDSATGKLEAFLEDLLESSSDLIHVERLFKLPGSDNVPIILSSKINEEEGYVYHTSCDIHAATQVQNALTLMSLRSFIVADIAAMRELGEYLATNIILICSPFANAFTRYVLDQAMGLSSAIGHRFGVDEHGQRYIADLRGRRWTANDPMALPDPDDPVAIKRDYALAARYRNPWAPGKFIYVFCGIYTIGTQACGDLLANPSEYGRLPWASEEFAAILELEYSEFNPHKYDYKISAIHIG